MSERETTNPPNEELRAKRWRLVLGREEQESTELLSEEERHIDKTLDFLYSDQNQKAGLGSSRPHVSPWLGNIRQYFPQTVVSILQKDALKKLKLEQILQEDELLNNIVPDVHLAVALLSLKGAVPQKAKEVARQIVRRLAQELTQKLKPLTEKALRGALSRQTRNSRPKLNELDWLKTVRKNLRHYQPDHKIIIPQKLEGRGRKGRSVKDLIICLDQSGSMATSVVYTGILASVMASLNALKTHLVVFDVQVADLTEYLHDPVEVLFGTQLGGGTDIAKALAYSRQLISRPADTIFLLITDLFEGGSELQMMQHIAQIQDSGARLIVLLSLSDQGIPVYNQAAAARIQDLGIPVFGCTPDAFPGLVASYL